MTADLVTLFAASGGAFGTIRNNGQQIGRAESRGSNATAYIGNGQILGYSRRAPDGKVTLTDTAGRIVARFGQ